MNVWKDVQISQIFHHLITIYFLSKLVRSAWNTNSNQRDCDRHQLLSISRLITLRLWGATCSTSWKVNSKMPQMMQQLKGKVATNSAFILQVFTAYHFTSVCSQAKQGGEDPHMWRLRACGFKTWSASITVNLLNLTICNFIAQAAYSLPTSHKIALPRHSPVREHSGYHSFMMWHWSSGQPLCPI